MNRSHDHSKTPWNPSKTATARVLNPLPAPTVHEACGQPVAIAHHNDVYGREYSDWPWMYRCPKCDASVGMHPFTAIPLGTLADKALRNARKECKAPFERLYLDRRMTRDQAYARLAEHLGIPVGECHFGWFTHEQCAEAARWARGAVATFARRA